MLLAIDVGNTNTVIGLDTGDGEWIHQWRFSTVRSALSADWSPVITTLATRDSFDLKRVNAICIGSVVPSATSALIAFAHEWCGIEPLVLSSALRLNLPLAMDEPTQVGADRIANAVAARALTREAVIVVDLGTATKVEAIAESEGFLGGAIAIGLGVSIETLAARAAKLFSMDLQLPRQPIGRNTTEALQAGIVLGHQHLIRGLIADFRKTLGLETEVILTGGHVHQVGPGFLPEARHVPDLTLDGIRIIHELNRS